MSDESKPSPPPGGQFLVYQTADGKLKIDVRFEGETVWLTQQHMAELFQTSKQNVSLHIQNIYEERELERGATVKESLTVQLEGSHAGRISHEMAQAKAELEYDKFKALTAAEPRPVDADFDMAVKQWQKLPKPKKPKRPKP